MNSNGLKPCPFCGREINNYEMEMESGKGITYLNIRCECGVEVEIDSFGLVVFTHFGSHFVGDTALDIWNRRTAGGENDDGQR